MRYCFKIIRKILLGLLIAVLSYGAMAWLLGHWRIAAEPIQSNRVVTLYLLSNGVHTDIVMPYHHPAFDWSNYARPADTHAKDDNVAYMAIGWGDKGFYLNTPTWRDLTATTAIKAISGFNETALHVRFYSFIQPSERSIAIEITEQQYQQLARNIAADFKMYHGKSQVILGAHYDNDDAFYEAHGRYSLFNTCNTWSNRHLKQVGAGGVMWTPFAHDLLSAFQERNPSADMWVK